VHVLALALVSLHGLVMQGPTQPVCQDGIPCSKPAANVQLVFHGLNGSTVIARTDARGRYALKLRRGTYTVDTLPGRRIGSGLQPRRITVRRTTQRVDFDLDTGIR
jgi:hypothetical protein